jgi:hypothetical protein
LAAEHWSVAPAYYRLNGIQPLMRSFQMRNEPAYLFFDSGCALNISGGMIERHIQSLHKGFADQQALIRLHDRSSLRSMGLSLTMPVGSRQHWTNIVTKG